MHNTPASIASLAHSIASSWRSSFNTKYILIAPPLSAPKPLFRLLEQPNFLKEVLGDTAKHIKLASLSEEDFTQDGFLRKLAASWGGLQNKHCPPSEMYGVVQSALEKVLEEKQIPVLLVERFHSGLKQLDRDFGIKLRDLENAFQIRTVVELPIGIDDLRKHLESTADGCPFLQSNWSDGYEEKLLLGYSQDELRAIVKNEFAKSNDFADDLFSATAGLPELLNPLAHHLIKIKDRQGLETFLRNKSPSLCKRLFNWLDIGQSTVYQDLLRRSLTEQSPEHRGITLAAHSWRGLLLDKDGKLRFRMLAWASADRLVDTAPKALAKEIFGQIEKDGPDPIPPQLNELAQHEHSPNKQWKCIEIACRFFNAANPTGEEWRAAQAALSDLGEIIEEQTGKPIRDVSEALGRWIPIVNLMLELQRTTKKWEFARIGEKVCRLGSDTQLRAYLQLLKYQVELTKRKFDQKRMDAHAARSAIGAIPESVFQLYSWKLLSVQFWEYEHLPGIGPCKFLGQEHSEPQPGKRLDFRSMLLIHWQKSNEIDPRNHLLFTEDEFRDISDLYGTDRSVSAHEFTPVGNAAWQRYYDWSTTLIERFWKILASDGESPTLPDIALAIKPVRAALESSQTVGARQPFSGRT